MHRRTNDRSPRSRLALLLSAVLLTACATATVLNPVTGRQERTVMDEASELAEGRKAHEQVLAEYGAYGNARLQAYVDDIGQRLARHSHRGDLDWHFTVLDSAEINAFALPGGYVYVTRGLMAYLDSEADLAGVIGHEIGHVTARHGAQHATRQQNASVGVLAATILGAVLEAGGVEGAVDLASQVSQGVAAGYIARYSREQELQADELGAEYLARSNYDPRNMVDVILVLKNQERFAADSARAEGRAPPEGNHWLSSHPTNDQRLQEIRQTAARYKTSGDYADEGRSRYLRAIDGMIFGESREQGLTRGQDFYHVPLGFALTAPAGWTIRNSPQAVVLVNRDGNAGLIVRTVPPNAGDSHDEIIRTVLRPESGSVRRGALNGLPATHFVGTRRNQQGQVQPIETTIVSGPGARHYLLVYASADGAALQRAYRQMLEAESSFRAMTAADRAAARPWTIGTVPYPRGGFEQLARKSPLTQRPEQQLRLINGVYAGGEPRLGQLVKVVE
jgi:predicted Zn-dependent protease